MDEQTKINIQENFNIFMESQELQAGYLMLHMYFYGEQGIFERGKENKYEQAIPNLFTLDLSCHDKTFFKNIISASYVEYCSLPEELKNYLIRLVAIGKEAKFEIQGASSWANQYPDWLLDYLEITKEQINKTNISENKTRTIAIIEEYEKLTQEYIKSKKNGKSH